MICQKNLDVYEKGETAQANPTLAAPRNGLFLREQQFSLLQMHLITYQKQLEFAEIELGSETRIPLSDNGRKPGQGDICALSHLQIHIELFHDDHSSGIFKVILI